MKKILVLGSFDILHTGHINLINRVAAMGDYLIVGVASDALYLQDKKRNPVFLDRERASIISAIKGVDEVFINDSMTLSECISIYHPDAVVFGKDWEGKMAEKLSNLCEIIYLERTDFISSSMIKEKIKKLNNN